MQKFSQSSKNVRMAPILKFVFNLVPKSLHFCPKISKKSQINPYFLDYFTSLNPWFSHYLMNLIHTFCLYSLSFSLFYSPSMCTNSIFKSYYSFLCNFFFYRRNFIVRSLLLLCFILFYFILFYFSLSLWNRQGVVDKQ